jgi:hypothetical protein
MSAKLLLELERQPLSHDDSAGHRAQRPRTNRHRLADGWQGSTVGAILQHPKYMNRDGVPCPSARRPDQIFGRWTKTETLMDPDNVSEGHVVRFRRASSERIVRSRRPAHPAIVSVAQFTRSSTCHQRPDREEDRGNRRRTRKRGCCSIAPIHLSWQRCTPCFDWRSSTTPPPRSSASRFARWVRVVTVSEGGLARLRHGL